MDWKNKLYFGDNLGILRREVPDASVDLIYLDPPSDPNAFCSALFKRNVAQGLLSGPAAFQLFPAAQITSFGDAWKWGRESEADHREILESGTRKLADPTQALPREPPTAKIGKSLYDIRAIVVPRL